MTWVLADPLLKLPTFGIAICAALRAEQTSTADSAASEDLCTLEHGTGMLSAKLMLCQIHETY